MCKKQFQIFKIEKFELKVTVHYDIWQKHPIVIP